MTTTLFFIFLIIAVACFVQGATGFGLSLVSMPLLVSLVGIQIATPLMALVGFVVSLIMLMRYREAFNLRVSLQMIGGALFGIPLGIFVLKQVDETLITRLLGMILIGYSLYALSKLTLPHLNGRYWSYIFGFAGGLLSGAYNTSGPPVIIYGHSRRWPPQEFKSNLQGFFLFNGVMVAFSHFLLGNVTSEVWRDFFWGIPAIILGLTAGFLLDKYLDPARFRQIVLVMLIFLGVRLLF